VPTLVRLPPLPASPRTALVIPTWNEAPHIAATLAALLDGSEPERLEVLVVDGGSSDATVAIVRGLMPRWPRLRLLANPRRTQAAACNLALEACPEAEVIVRCDAHAYYPPGFIGRAVALLAEHHAGGVVYADRPLAGCQAENRFQYGVGFAQNNRWGVGQSRYRLGRYSGWVEHRKHGCFRRDVLVAAGGYDESFTHNEDSELSYRLGQRGAKLWLDATLWVGYVPRAAPSSLARQYYLYGRGRAQNLRKHRTRPSPRQWAPSALVVAQLAALAAAPHYPEALMLPALYTAALGSVAGLGARRQRRWAVLWSAPAMAIMHHTFGAGFLLHWARFAAARAQPTPPAASGTRPLLHRPAA
jgi:succinoglycan biosynthesis protein ExoA